MGEQEFTQNAMVKAVGEAMVEQARAAEHRITTAGGRFQVRWDENGSASAFAHFAERDRRFRQSVTDAEMLHG